MIFITGDEKLETFLKRVDERVEHHNHMQDALPIVYRHGIAFHEGNHVRSINELIALSDQRISQPEKVL